MFESFRSYDCVLLGATDIGDRWSGGFVLACLRVDGCGGLRASGDGLGLRLSSHSDNLLGVRWAKAADAIESADTLGPLGPHKKLLGKVFKIKLQTCGNFRFV